MKIVHAILWLFGFSVVPNEDTQNSSVPTATFTDADYAGIYATYMQLRGNGTNHEHAWAAIVSAKKWDAATSETALHGFDIYLKNNPVQETKNESTDNSSVLL